MYDNMLWVVLYYIILGRNNKLGSNVNLKNNSKL